MNHNSAKGAALSLGVVLTGGGARGAYQAGMLKAIAEILEELGRQPLQYTGLSAGAINAAFCAAGADDLVAATRQLCTIWSTLHPSQVFRSDISGLSRIALRLIIDISFGSLSKRKFSNAFLDHSPLISLVRDNIDFSRITKHLQAGYLSSVVCSAFDYDRSQTVSFVHSHKEFEPWNRPRRRSEKTVLTAEHVVASSSIPLLFPPTKIDGRYFGDGSLRNTAPIGPAINMGVRKLIILGVRYSGSSAAMMSAKPGSNPTLGRILGLMLNSLFFDSTDVDVERVGHINEIIKSLPQQSTGPTAPQPIDFIWLRPSADLGLLAGEMASQLPQSLRFLLGGLGAPRESSELASYLLFHKNYTSRLVEIGYSDGWNQKQAIVDFLTRKT